MCGETEVNIPAVPQPVRRGHVEVATLPHVRAHLESAETPSEKDDGIAEKLQNGGSSLPVSSAAGSDSGSHHKTAAKSYPFQRSYFRLTLTPEAYQCCCRSRGACPQVVDQQLQDLTLHWLCLTVSAVERIMDDIV